VELKRSKMTLVFAALSSATGSTFTRLPAGEPVRVDKTYSPCSGGSSGICRATSRPIAFVKPAALK
jgi:hypothetical protein